MTIATAQTDGRRWGVIAWLLLTQALALLSLFPWLLIAALSVMAFDAPGSVNQPEPWIFVGIVWSYPVFPILCALIAWLLFVLRKPRASLIVTSLPLLPPLALIGLLIVGQLLFILRVY
ncbi:MAG: hypothetical protein HY782_13780 [Chloroflexi bacterium]|nr:hypothetical protein [Chloroflexota bacterium]